jgi:arylsulfatase
MGRRTCLVLALLLVVGAGLRIAAMHDRPLLDDEVGTALRVQRPYADHLTRFQIWLNQPAFTVVARACTQVMGPTELAIRLPALILGIAGIGAAFLLGRELMDHRAGLVAAALLAVSPYHVFYSQMARSYSTCATLATLAFVLLFRLLRTPGWKLGALYCVVVVLTSYAHLGAAGLGLAHAAVVAVAAVGRRRAGDSLRGPALALVWLVVAGLVTALLYLPMVDEIQALRTKIGGQGEAGLSFSFAPMLLSTMAGGRGWSIYAYAAAWMIGTAALWRRRPAAGIMLVAWPLSLLVLHAFNGSRYFPWTMTRFFFPLLPALVVGAACGLVVVGSAVTARWAARPGWRRAATLMLVLLFVLVTSPKALLIAVGDKGTPWPAMVDFMHRELPQNLRIFNLTLRFNALKHYADRAWPGPRRVFEGPGLLKKTGRFELADTPPFSAAFVVELADIGPEDVPHGCFVRRFRHATLIWRTEPEEHDVATVLSDFVALVDAVADWADGVDPQLGLEDWVYWRDDLHHEHAFTLERAMVDLLRDQAEALRRLGRPDRAADSEHRAAAWYDQRRARHLLGVSWDMLRPHADFVHDLVQCFAPQRAAARPPDDARPNRSPPNILLIVADDMGFSDAGCYGGEIATPHLDLLAAGGLRFTRFYTTPRCWPTRAALLTGYHPQQVRRGETPELSGRRFGGRGVRPDWARLVPERLRPLGYRSYHSGKWHIDGKPVDNGFDRSYHLKDHSRYFNPNNHTLDGVKQARVEPGSGFYATTAIADHAIACLAEHAAEHRGRPFFHLLAFTAPHLPLQAPQEDIDRYRERYLGGWHELRRQRHARLAELGLVAGPLSALEEHVGPPRSFPEAIARLGPDEVDRPLRWGRLTAGQQRFQAGKMAIHAAMIDRMDREIGRVLAQVRAMGAWRDTVILFLSDNGASSEILIRGNGHDRSAPMGSATTFLCLGPGFSSVANTPFRRHKTWVHEGGISSPLIVHWPHGIAGRNEIRSTVAHAIDIAPTLLELAGGELAPDPGAPPVPGRSLVNVLAGDGPPLHRELWFYHHGHRALQRGRWKALSESGSDWELYDLSRDRSEQHDVALEHPERVAELAARWQEMAAEFKGAATRDLDTEPARPKR